MRTDGRTDTETDMRKPIAAFGNFANAPKNGKSAPDRQAAQDAPRRLPHFIVQCLCKADRGIFSCICVVSVQVVLLQYCSFLLSAAAARLRAVFCCPQRRDFW